MRGCGESSRKPGVFPFHRKPGLTLMEMMKGIAEGKIKALYVMGENPILTDPNANRVKEELQHLDLLVTQDIFLSETGELAHVILPGVSFVEKDGTFTNTERRVQRVRRALKPVGKRPSGLADHLRPFHPLGLSDGLQLPLRDHGGNCLRDPLLRGDSL